ncbi:JAB domain-containing protein [Chitinophagaceae bacterium MMS25-I14]
MTIRLTKEEKIRILNSDDIYAIMQRILLRDRKIDRRKEHFWIVCLAADNRILLIDLVGLGNSTAVPADPVDIFSFALQKQSVKIVMVHNHPSNRLTPSDNDRKFTNRMVAIGKFLNCPVLDHMIIGEEGYYSFANKHQLYTDIDLTFKEMDDLRLRVSDIQAKLAAKDKETKKLIKEKEKAEKKAEEMAQIKTNELALNFLKQGVSVDVIVAATGLTVKEIGVLKRKK